MTSQGLSFGAVPKDAAVSNLVVNDTLVANKVVANTIDALQITASDANIEAVSASNITASSISTSELTVNGQSIIPTTATNVPGTINQVLTSAGDSKTILAPGSTLTTTGVLNLTPSTAKVQFNSNDVLSGTANSLAVGIGAKGFGVLGNTVVGPNAGPALTTGNRNTLIGGNAGQGLINGQLNVGIGFNSQINTTSTGCVVIGQSAACILGDNNTAIGNVAQVIPASGSIQHSIVVGDGANSTATAVDGGIVIGGNGAFSAGAKTTYPSVVIGAQSSDSGDTQTGSVILGTNITVPSTIGNCICLGNGAMNPTASNVVTFPPLFAQAPSLFGAVTSIAPPFQNNPTSALRVQINGTTYQIPLYPVA